MSDTILVAVIGIPLALIGYWIQAALARKSEQDRFFRDSKREIYAKLLVAVGDLGNHKGDEQKLREAKAAAAASRCLIGLYGSAEVIREVAKTFEHGDFSTDEGQSNFVKAIAAMRRDTGAVSDSEINSSLTNLIFTPASKRQ